MHVHLQYRRPGIGEHDLDRLWALIGADGYALSHHHTPEAGLLEAIGHTDDAPLRMTRRGPWRYDIIDPAHS